MASSASHRPKTTQSHPELFTPELLQSLQQSGQSVQQFAKQHDISSWCLYQYRRRQGLHSPQARKRNSTPSRMLPVQVVPDAPPNTLQGAPLVVRSPAGWSLEIPAGSNPQQLRNVLALVQELS